MILRGARVALNAAETTVRDLRIPGRRPSIDLTGYLVLPGLINAHDHLEFNLYPRLGHGPYANAGDWARDVYHPAQAPISDQRKISKSTRLLWGGLKNLLCGVTTVCHHNPMDFAVFDRNFPVRVVKQFGWAHSLEFSPDLAERFRQTPVDWPFVLHLGEGTDAQARREIFRLDEMQTLDDRTILVHAVGLDQAGIERARDRGASIVWCPSSNLFLLGRTLSADVRNSGIPIALGSDSAVTAEGDLLDELRVAQACGATPPELYDMVTGTPASMLRLTADVARAFLPAVSRFVSTLLPASDTVSKASVRNSTRAPSDFAIFRDIGKPPAETLLAGATPEMVIVDGKIKLISQSLAARIGGSWDRFAGLSIHGRGEVLVQADVPGLYQRAARVLGEVKLAGRRVSLSQIPQ